MKTLKSIILTSILTLTLVSCDMDKYPYDKIPLDSAAKSFADCQKLRTYGSSEFQSMHWHLKYKRMVLFRSLTLAINSEPFIVGKQTPQKVLFLLYGVIATSLLPNVIYSLKV